MLIYNYNYERAENNRINNDKQVAELRKLERGVRIAQRTIVAILIAAMVFMVLCVAAMFTIYASELPLPVSIAASIITALCGVVVAMLVIDQTSKKKVSDDHYDDLETRYHRLVKSYKKVDVILTSNRSVVCICENERGEKEVKELKPRYIQTPKRLTQPTLDLGASCLWVPDSFVAPTNLEGAL